MKYIKKFESKKFESTVFHTMKQIDEIIDKISEFGYEKLDNSEKAILNNFSHDDADIHKILVEMNELTKKFKILNKKMREYDGPGSAKDKYFGIWLELNTKMTKLEHELKYLYKVESPDDIWIYQDKHGLTTPDYDYDDEYNEGYLDPNFQGKGIGKYLFNMVPKPRRLKTTTDNNQSNDFYKYQGLKNIGTEQGRKRELNIWTDIKENKENKENNELSGKHSFMTFLQLISNHDFHFILNESYTKLYNYHFLFSTETIKDVEDYIEIFKYKQSLPLAYKALQNIKGSKLSFFFGIKDNSLLRYGFIDLDTQRSYIVGEFQVSGAYFNSISKYKSIQTINKILQNTDVKNLSTLSKIKQDFENFYTSKKNSKIIINNNQVINFFDKTQFTEDDIRMNRPYRVLDQWISKKSWRNRVEYSVDDTTDQIQFIILVK